jgi:hypothetical protein
MALVFAGNLQIGTILQPAELKLNKWRGFMNGGGGRSGFDERVYDSVI